MDATNIEVDKETIDQITSAAGKVISIHVVMTTPGGKTISLTADAAYDGDTIRFSIPTAHTSLGDLPMTSGEYRPEMTAVAVRAMVAASRFMWSGDPEPTWAELLESCGEEYAIAFMRRWHDLTGPANT